MAYTGRMKDLRPTKDEIPDLPPKCTSREFLRAVFVEEEEGKKGAKGGQTEVNLDLPTRRRVLSRVSC